MSELAEDAGPVEQQGMNQPDRWLGPKVEHLIGLLVSRYPFGHLREKSIAEYLHLTPQQWARLKKQTKPIDVTYLGNLVSLFRLDVDYGLTYEIFQDRTLAEFKVLLADHRVGLDHVGRVDGTRRIIRTLRNVTTNSIAIERVYAGTRAGGIGVVENDAGEPPLLHASDKVTLSITHRENGHLLVFNDSIEGDFTCLMPSSYAPDTARTGTVTRLPAIKGELRPFDVKAPSEGYRRYKGPYYIYAIWTREAPTELAHIMMNAEKRAPFRLPDIEVRKLGVWLEKMDVLATTARGEKPAPPPFELHVGVYRVICPPD